MTNRAHKIKAGKQSTKKQAWQPLSLVHEQLSQEAKSLDLEIPSVKDKVSEEEWELRVDLAAAYRMIAHFGWDDLIFNNLSVRLPEAPEQFLINPYGMLFEEVTASSLIKVDIQGNIQIETPFCINPTAYAFNAAILNARSDINSVFHVHSPDGAAVSAQKEGLLPITQTALAAINAGIAYHDYEGIVMTVDEGKRIVEELGDNQLMILRNHGTLAVGKTLQDAMLMMYFLEKACTFQIKALSGGKDQLYYPSQESLERSKKQGRKALEESGGGQFIWPTIRRMMDRIDPSYKK